MLDFFAQLFDTSVELKREIRERKKAEQTLLRANDELERRVWERTAQVASTNAILKSSEDRLLLAMEAGRMGVWEWDTRDNHVQWSGNLEQSLGLAPGAFGATRESFTRLIHPEDQVMVAQAIDGSLKDSQSFDIEFRMVRPDRGIHWIASKATVFRDEQGEPERMIGISMDITARRQAEEALRQNEEQFRRAIVDAPIPIIVHAEDGEVLQISKAWTRLSGYTREDMPTYQRWLELAYGPEAPKVSAHVQSLFQLREGTREREFVITTRNGERRTWVFTNSAPGKFRDGRRFLVGMAMDVTDAREADRRKDEFLATLAHELRNPLAPIRNAIQIMSLSKLADPQLEWARDVVGRQVQQMSRLVDDLLDVSRISRGKVELRKERVELATLVGRAVETTRPLIEERRHDLSLMLPKEPVWLEVDPTRLEQILANLLNNAAKYTEAGGKIWLSATSESRAAVIRVRDNGIGIAPDKLNHVFNMFVQMDPGKDRAMGGLGIGLSLVRRLVEMHGGAVTAHSEGPQKGSEFVVTLPLATPRRDGQAPVQTPPVKPNGPIASRRLLVVDDNVDAAESLALLLRLEGHDVCVAHDGFAALARAPAFAPTLAILDIGLPKMDGYEVARRLRQLAGLEKVKLIALTGWGNEEDRRRAQDAGFDCHLVKPVEPATLRAVLGELCG